MIRLYRPGPVWGLPSMSPFAVKLETYLRMTEIPYQAVPGGFRNAPKGRIPHIKDGDFRLGDSGLIIDYLKNKHGDPLDQGLSAEARGRALAMRRMMEDHLYFIVAYLRWSDEESWSHVRAHLLSYLPGLMGRPLVQMIRRSFVKEIGAQGVGDHTRDELVRMARDDIAAVAALLGDQAYFQGSEPTSIDATMYGFLVHAFNLPWNCPIAEHTRTYPNLVAYVDRMKRRYWPEYVTV